MALALRGLSVVEDTIIVEAWEDEDGRLGPESAFSLASRPVTPACRSVLGRERKPGNDALIDEQSNAGSDTTSAPNRFSALEDRILAPQPSSHVFALVKQRSVAGDVETV